MPASEEEINQALANLERAVEEDKREAYEVIHVRRNIRLIQTASDYPALRDILSLEP